MTLRSLCTPFRASAWTQAASELYILPHPCCPLPFIDPRFVVALHRVQFSAVRALSCWYDARNWFNTHQPQPNYQTQQTVHEAHKNETYMTQETEYRSRIDGTTGEWWNNKCRMMHGYRVSPGVGDSDIGKEEKRGTWGERRRGVEIFNPRRGGSLGKDATRGKAIACATTWFPELKMES